MPDSDTAASGLAEAPARLGIDGLAAAIARVQRLMESRDRVILGICGAPGAGKSTLAHELVRAIDPAGRNAVHVPMDGFHLADAELDRLGIRDRKGAIDTFDGHGYLALLRRLAAETNHDTLWPGGVVYAPAFDRDIEQPIAGSIAIDENVRLVVTEGNYLLDPSDPWCEIRELITEAWYYDEPDDSRRERLAERHVRYGKTLTAARAWVEAVDEPNAQRIASTRHAADAVVRIGTQIKA